jgi:hypothetical protein
VDFKDENGNFNSVPLVGGVAVSNSANVSYGNHTITATYRGNNGLLTSSASLTQKLFRRPSTASVSSSLNPASVGQPLSFTATVTPSGTRVPTGNVSLTIHGNKPISKPLANGAVVFPWTFALAGDRTITATYAGDAWNQPSAPSVITQTVNPQTTTTNLTASPNPSTVNQAVTYVAKVTGINGAVPTGTVTFAISGNKPVALPLVNGQVIYTWTYAKSGPRTVTASYSGDANNVASASATLNQSVQMQAN